MSISVERNNRYKQANEKAIERRRSASSTPKKMNRSLLACVEKRLFMKWSPDQIAGVLRHSSVFISYVSIYRHILANRKKGGDLYTHLRHRGKKYNRKGLKTAGRGCIPNRVDIWVIRLAIETLPIPNSVN